MKERELSCLGKMATEGDLRENSTERDISPQHPGYTLITHHPKL